MDEVKLLAVLEADNRASEKFRQARDDVLEYAAALDAVNRLSQDYAAEQDRATTATDRAASTAEKAARSEKTFRATIREEIPDLDALDLSADDVTDATEKAAHATKDFGEDADRSRGKTSLWRQALEALLVPFGKEPVLEQEARRQREELAAVTEKVSSKTATATLRTVEFGDILDSLKSKFQALRGGADEAEAATERVSKTFEETASKTKRLKKDTEDADKELEKAASDMDKVGNAAKNAGGRMSRFGFWTTAITVGFGALSGAASGVLALGIPAFFMAGGLAADHYYNSIKQAQASNQQLTQTQKAMLPVLTIIHDDFQKLQPVIGQTIAQFGKLMTSLGPALTQAISALGPIISSLGSSIGGTIAILVQGLAPLVSKVQPVIEALGGGLQILAKALVGLFASIDFSAAAQGLQDLFQAAAVVVQVFGQLLAAFTPMSHILLGQLLPPIVQLIGTIVSALVPALTAILPPVVQIVAEVASALNPILNALTPIVQLVASTIGRLLAAIAPLISVLTPIVVLLVQMANAALKPLLAAITPLIQPLVMLAATILTELLQILSALQPAWNSLIAAVAPLLPLLGPLIMDLTQIVVTMTPIVVWIAKLVAGLVQLLAPAVEVVIAVVLRFLNGPLTMWPKFIGDAIEFIKKAGHDFIEIFEGIGSFLAGLFTNNVTGAVNGIKKIFHGFLDFFSDWGSFFYNIGKDIITGIWNGISGAAGWLLDKVKDIGSSIVNGFKKVLSIFSPSRVMADQVGAQIPAGIAQGILSNQAVIGQAAQRAARNAVTGANLGLNSGQLSLAASNATGAANGTIIVQPVFQGNQLMSDRDMDVFVSKVGNALATSILPRAGVHIRM